MDIMTIVGLILGIGAILGGQVLEGGHVSSIMQYTAAIIVFGGTWGAVCVSFPMKAVKDGFSQVSMAFTELKEKPAELIREIVELAKKARKEGILALEADAEKSKNHFLKKALGLVSSGTDPKLVREILEKEIAYKGERGHAAAKVWESAGAFSPTIGIIGAVLGLIHVMENLSDASKLGSGIAVAFVATVYGVATANLVYIPIGTKMKLKHRQEEIVEEIILEGTLAIQAGDTPSVIQEKLLAFLDEKEKAQKAEKK